MLLFYDYDMASAEIISSKQTLLSVSMLVFLIYIVYYAIIIRVWIYRLMATLVICLPVVIQNNCFFLVYVSTLNRFFQRHQKVEIHFTVVYVCLFKTHKF